MRQSGKWWLHAYATTQWLLGNDQSVETLKGECAETRLVSAGLGVRYHRPFGAPAARAEGSLERGAELHSWLTEVKTVEGDDAANAAFAALSPEDQQALQAFLMSETVYSEIISPAMEQVSAAGCWYRVKTIESRQAVFGNLFWRDHQSISWCGNGPGGTLSNIGCSAWASDTGWGYWFDGHRTYCALEFRYANTFKYLSQGSFCAGVEYCMVHATPWIRQQGVDDGQYYSWYGS